MLTKPLPKKQMIPQDSWQLYIFTYSDWWAFNLLDYCITNEIFCCGTETALTELYKLQFGKEAGWSADMIIKFTTEPQDNAITTWSFIEDDANDPNAGYYLDSATGMKMWLCELWSNMWGNKPPILYLTITAA